MECEECGSVMEKKGVMESGNSLYDKFVCKNCGREKTVCRGLK